MDLGTQRYKVTGIVTNRDIPGEELIWWYRQRCSKSEEVHGVMKQDLAGGNWARKRFKAIRFWLINLPGRVAEHSGGLIIRLAGGHPSNETLFAARRRILALNDTG